MTNYTAHFQPQVWDRDYAVDAGPETAWDVTDLLTSAPEDTYLRALRLDVDENHTAVDTEDALFFLPTTPGEVREHLRGEPYTGYVYVDSDAEEDELG